MVPVPPTLQKQIQEKDNANFLREVYRLRPGASKAEREKVLNSGNKKKRMLLIRVLHQIMKGEIRQKRETVALLERDQANMNHLVKKFEESESVQLLLKANDRIQRQILSEVTDYHLILQPLFKHR